MNVKLKSMVLIASVSCAATVYLSAADVRKIDRLPDLDAKATTGLGMQAKPVRPTFKVGEQVKLLCTITNNSDSIKPLAWWNGGLHFTCIRGEATDRLGGLLPESYPEIPEPIQIRSKPNLPRPGYILYLPPHQSLTFRLTYRAASPETFRGRICYDPLAPRAGVDPPVESPSSWKHSQLFSNMLEYEIVEPPK